jgi:hypothetical protein
VAGGVDTDLANPDEEEYGYRSKVKSFMEDVFTTTSDKPLAKRHRILVIRPPRGVKSIT